MRSPHRDAGITFVELLVVVASLVIVIGAVDLTWIIGGRMYLSSESYVHVQQQARNAFQNMTRELRQAGGTITTGASQCTFQMALGYNLPAPCPASAVCFGAADQGGVAQAGWSIRYRLVGTLLTRDILDQSGAPQLGTRILAHDVTLLSFTYVGAPTKMITMQLQVQESSSQLPGGAMKAAPASLISMVKLRNP